MSGERDLVEDRANLNCITCHGSGRIYMHVQDDTGKPCFCTQGRQSTSQPYITYDDIKPVVQRIRDKSASIADHITYLRFELREAINALPPEKPDDQFGAYHAGCCAVRAFSDTYQLEDLIAKGKGR